LWPKFFEIKLKILNFQDRFYILLKIRLSGVAEQEYARLYGKSRIKDGKNISVIVRLSG